MIKLEVIVSAQKLLVLEDDHCIKEYPVSTAKKGVGERRGSEQTPTGLHYIRAKIGAHLPINTVFKGRRPTGEIYTPELGASYPNRDWILTRILWLSGLELQKNRLGEVDTMRRYIYIHGTPALIQGMPESHGCVRMQSQDIIELFDSIPYRTQILIKE